MDNPLTPNKEHAEANAARLATITKISQRALAGMEPSTFMHEAAAAIAVALDVEYCMVLELLPNGETFLLRAGVGWKDGLVGRATVGTKGNSQAGYTLLSPEPVIVEDLRAETRFNGPQFLFDHGVAAGMSVNIPAQSRPFGVLGAHTAKRRTFTDDDVQFLQAVANVLGMVVERELIEKEMRLLQTITVGISTSKNTRDALIFVMKEVCAFTGWIYGEGWKPDPGATFLERDHTYYSVAKGLEKFSAFTEGFLIFKGKGLPGRAWATKQPVWMKDVTQSQDYLRSQAAKEARLKTGIAFPILADNEVVAVVVFYKFEVIEQDEHLVKLISTVLTQLGPIIKRKQVEESHARFVTILETTPDFVGIANKKGQVCYVNRAGRKMVEIGADEDIFHTTIPQYHTEWAGRVVMEEGLPTALREGVWCGETALLSRSGRVIPVSQLIIAHKLPDGEIEFLSTIMRDLTGYKRQEEEKAAMKERLYHAQKLESVGRLAGGVAHEFNNILMAIVGYASLLQVELKNDAPLGDYVLKILRSAERAAGLIQGMLAFSRKNPGIPKPLNVNEVISGVKHLLEKVTGEDIELKIALSNKDCSIMADMNQMKQVLMNLVVNAKDAMPNGGLLTISTDIVELDDEFIKKCDCNRAEAYVILCVADTGAGIDEKTKERIFEPFFTTKGVGKNPGLGLSIAYGIVKQHGGCIVVDSAPGKGAAFKIYLPVNKQPGEKEEPSESCAAYETGTETVLLAEDEAEVREMLKILLEKCGYTVIAAANGEDAVQKFKENKDRVQMLICDVRMPRKMGKEAYDAMREIKPDLKALFMSGYSDEVVRKDGIFDKETNFISKPISPPDLLRKIREVLDAKA